MEPILLILLVTIAGSSGFGILSRCDISRCDTFSPEDFQRTMREFPPNDEELKEICPPLLEAIECFSSMVEECTGELFEDLGTSDNETLAQLKSTILNVMSLVRDVCNEDSKFGKDFRASAPCLKRAIAQRNEECASESNRLYDAFKFPEGFDEDELTEPLENIIAESRCLTMAFEMACGLKAIQKTCGTVARDVLMEVVKRPKMLRMGICSSEDLLTLKGQFLDFLEEQGEHRGFLENAFEFRKRRK